MSHKTTSWKSHSSTWRWTAGNDGRSPEGGKARQVGGHPALTREKTIGEHDQREMSMQAIPAPALVVVQAAFALRVFIELLDGPAAVGQLDEAMQWGVCWQVTVIPFDLATVPRYRALAEKPALRAGGDTMMARRQLRAARGPVHPHRHTLFAEDDVAVLGPRDGLPAVLRQGIEHGLGRIERRRVGLLGLAPPPRARWGDERGRAHLVRQAHQGRDAVSQVRFQADWNLNHIIVQATQRCEPALDFQTAQAASLLGVSDPGVLERAAREGRLLVTHDFHDMPQHFAAFIQEQTRAGVLLVP